MMKFNKKTTNIDPQEIGFMKLSIDEKQDKLTAGENITIEDNVISAVVSGGQTIQMTGKELDELRPTEEDIGKIYQSTTDYPPYESFTDFGDFKKGYFYVIDHITSTGDPYWHEQPVMNLDEKKDRYWKLIYHDILAEEVRSITIDRDRDGNRFELEELFIVARTQPMADKTVGNTWVRININTETVVGVNYLFGIGTAAGGTAFWNGNVRMELIKDGPGWWHMVSSWGTTNNNYPNSENATKSNDSNNLSGLTLPARSIFITTYNPCMFGVGSEFYIYGR